MGPRTIRRPPQQRDHSTDSIPRIDNLKIWLKELVRFEPTISRSGPARFIVLSYRLLTPTCVWQEARVPAGGQLMSIVPQDCCQACGGKAKLARIKPFPELANVDIH